MKVLLTGAFGQLGYVSWVSLVHKCGFDVVPAGRVEFDDPHLAGTGPMEAETTRLRTLRGGWRWLLIVFTCNDTTRNSLSGTMRLLTEQFLHGSVGFASAAEAGTTFFARYPLVFPG